jgi:hypothetical protein
MVDIRTPLSDGSCERAIRERELTSISQHKLNAVFTNKNLFLGFDWSFLSDGFQANVPLLLNVSAGPFETVWE